MVNIRRSWDRIARSYLERYDISTDVVHYGPLCPGEDELRLLGDVAGNRALDLGCGGGQNAIALTRLGAAVTAVDFSSGQLQQAAKLAALHNADIDFLQADISDISMLPDCHFDLALSACAIAFAENIQCVFSGAFRVLKPGGTFILSDMNPLQYILDEFPNGVRFNNEYPFEPILLKWRWDFGGRNDGSDRKITARFQHYVRSISHYHNELTAAGFVVSKILEPKSTLDSPHSGFSREIWQEYRYIAEHIPITFIFKCQRP